MNASDTSPPLLRLSRDIVVRPDQSNGKLRYIIEDRERAKFYRVGQREYVIASAFDGLRSIEQAIEFARVSAPDLNWTPTAIDKAIRWFTGVGLLQSDKATSKAKQTASSSLANFDPFFFRLPFVSGKSIESVAGRLTWAFRPVSVLVAATVIAMALVVLLADGSEFMRYSAELFVPDRWLNWFVAWLVLKLVHEFGHAAACVHVGGTVRQGGIGMMFMMPTPFIDLTDSWRLESRYARLLCSIAGIATEMVVAALAVLVCYWVQSESIRFTCAAIATLGTFSTLAFNANPLARFDGYFVLSDLLNRPNLWGDGQAALKRFLGQPFRRSQDRSQWLLTVYGMLCFIYRILIVVGFAMATIITWHGVGVLVTLLAAYLWYVKPYLKKRLQSKSSGATTARDVRWRFRGLRYGLLAAVIAVASFVPSPFQPSSPGYVSFVEPTTIRNESAGFLSEILVQDGDQLEAGQAICQLENPKLKLERDQLAVEVAASEGRCRILHAQGKLADLQAEEAALQSNREQLEELEKQVSQLTIRAPQSGRFYSRQLRRQRGAYLAAGSSLGLVARDERFEVCGSVSQDDIALMRGQLGKPVKVIVDGVGTLFGDVVTVLPRGSDELSNPTLAAAFGGPVPVQLVSDEKSGKDKLLTRTSRFEVRIALPDHARQKLRSGQLCRIQLNDRSHTILGIANRWRSAVWEWLSQGAKSPTGDPA